MQSRAEMIAEGIRNCAAAAERAVPLKSHSDPDVRELAIAVHFLSWGTQQIGIALTEQGRLNDLPLR